MRQNKWDYNWRNPPALVIDSAWGHHYSPCWHYRWHYKDRIELDVIIFWLTLGLTIHIVIWVLPFCFVFLQCKIASYMFSLHIQGNYTSYLEVQLVFNYCWIILNLIVVVSPHFTSVSVNEREESVQAVWIFDLWWIVPCITLYCSFPSLFKTLFPGDKNLLLTEIWSRHSTREKNKINWFQLKNSQQSLKCIHW